MVAPLAETAASVEKRSQRGVWPHSAAAGPQQQEEELCDLAQQLYITHGACAYSVTQIT